MCGIAGVWGEVSTARLSAMAHRLRHRGPDHEGTWIDQDEPLGLTYRRLSIIDLETGQQPFSNETGDIISVCNGEIYNYKELREQLLGRGHQLTSQADTEVLVHLYEEEGIDFVQRLRGMFAIALWDARQRRLVLVRDRVGKKPLYYAELDGEFVFASEIKGVLAGLRKTPALANQSIADYLCYGVVPAPATIYEGIRAIEPGHCAVVQQRRITKSNRYWRLEFQPKLAVDEAEAVERIDVALHEAVRLRLRSDVPVGCFLSGGIDSGIVTAIAANQSTQPLTTLTVGFNDDSFDERPSARRVAEQYGTDHHEIALQADIQKDLETIIGLYDQPFGDSSSIPSYYIAREARKHLAVVLNGDGGDEIAAGYRRHVAGWFMQRLSLQEKPGLRPWFERLLGHLPIPGQYRSRYAFVHRVIRGLALDPVARHVAWTFDGIDRDRLQRLVSGAMDGKHSNWNRALKPVDRMTRRLLKDRESCGVIDQMLGADFESMLCDDFLVKVDIATMAHGLEARSPLLDQELVALFARFPESVKLNGPTTKPLLRELSKRYLPAGAERAPKRGFEIPLVRWLRNDLRDLSRDTLLAREGLLGNLFDQNELRRLLEEPDVEPSRWSRWVWLLMVLGIWDQTVHREVQSARDWMA